MGLFSRKFNIDQTLSQLGFPKETLGDDALPRNELFRRVLKYSTYVRQESGGHLFADRDRVSNGETLGEWKEVKSFSDRERVISLVTDLTSRTLNEFNCASPTFLDSFSECPDCSPRTLVLSAFVRDCFSESKQTCSEFIALVEIVSAAGEWLVPSPHLSQPRRIAYPEFINVKGITPCNQDGFSGEVKCTPQVWGTLPSYVK